MDKNMNNINISANANKKNYVDNIFNQIVDYIINNLKKDDVQKKINKQIFDPIIEYIGRRLYPYVLITSFCFVIIIVLIFFLLWFK